jgi:acyl carrier protein
MESNQLAEIAANVLYLNSPGDIDVQKSLFSDYGMSSLDFVDFAFEVRTASNKQFHPDALWPVNALMTNGDYCSGGVWTDAGRAELAKIFDGHAEFPESPTVANLYALFSLSYVAHRLRAL